MNDPRYSVQDPALCGHATGDDPEADASTDQQIAAAAKKIFAPSKPADTKADSLEGLDF